MVDHHADGDLLIGLGTPSSTLNCNSRSLAATSRQFLHSAGIVRGFGHYWSFEAMADDFQVIDNDEDIVHALNHIRRA